MALVHREVTVVLSAYLLAGFPIAFVVLCRLDEPAVPSAVEACRRAGGRDVGDQPGLLCRIGNSLELPRPVGRSGRGKMARPRRRHLCQANCRKLGITRGTPRDPVWRHGAGSPNDECS